MSVKQKSDFNAIVLHFFARCFLFPYEEMTYELRDLFRQIELLVDAYQNQLTSQDILIVLNAFQGEDIQDLRADYVFLFSNRDQSDPVCPMLAGEFCTRFAISYDSGAFIDILYDDEFIPWEEESIDSVVNYLEYWASLCEPGKTELPSPVNLDKFLENHISSWIPHFCQILSKSANISFYRELGAALKQYILSSVT